MSPTGFFREIEKLQMLNLMILEVFSNCKDFVILVQKSSIDTRTNRSKLMTDKFILKIEREVMNVKKCRKALNRLLMSHVCQET